MMDEEDLRNFDHYTGGHENCDPAKCIRAPKPPTVYVDPEVVKYANIPDVMEWIREEVRRTHGPYARLVAIDAETFMKDPNYTGIDITVSIDTPKEG